MTELQKKEYDMLCLLVNICNKLDLTYYLVCGSALGAVKYGGFIPWDDDIDVALPREDYERFLQEAPSMLPEWCFVQNYRTDPRCHALGTKMRDSRTTFVERMCENLNIHHGVFIDVFPLDGCWSSQAEYKAFRKQRRIVDGKRRVHLTYRRFSPSGILPLRATFYYVINRCFGGYSDTAKAIGTFETLSASFPIATSSLWCNHANSASELEYAPSDQYGKGIMVSFEGLEVRVPENIDAYLTQKYGDWRADLPVEQQVGHHYYEILDLHHPYTAYIDKVSKGGGRITLKKTLD